MATDKLPTQSGRKALLNIAAGRPAQCGFAGTLQSLRRRGLVDTVGQLTEAGLQMVKRLTITPEISNG